MFILCIELTTLTIRQRGFYSYVSASRSSLTPYTSISPHALRAIIGVHRHGRHAPAPRPVLAGFLGAMTITVAAPHHLTQNIQIILQSLQVRGGGNKTVWAFGAELRSAVRELTSWLVSATRRTRSRNKGALIGKTSASNDVIQFPKDRKQMARPRSSSHGAVVTGQAHRTSGL